MLFILTYLCTSRVLSRNCHGKDILPVITGNSLVDWVSSEKYLASVNIHEETPISINEMPVKEVTLDINKVSSFLVDNKYATKQLADQIQNRFKLTNAISSAFNDFTCDDMSQKFKSLPSAQKNVNNFWNKIISRSAVLIKGTKQNNTVSLKVKRIEGQIKKRWAVVNKKRESYSYFCDVKEEECGHEYVNERVCRRVLKINPRTGRSNYEDECKNELRPKWKCKTKTKTDWIRTSYNLYKHDFTDSWNKTEVETMFASVQRQISSRLHF